MAYSTSPGAVISMSVNGAAETQRQIDGVGQSLSSLGSRSGASVGQINNVSQAVAALANRTGMSVGAVQNAMRMVPAQLQDIAVSLQGGQSPLTVLMQQGSQLTGMFNNNVGAALRATATSVLGLVNPYTVAAATVAALAVAYNQGSKEADAYNRSLIMSGNIAGTSAAQLADMAQEIGRSVGTQADAAQALAALTGTGQVGAENLKQFGRVAVSVQRNIGRSVEDTVKDFAELGKSPVDASLKLNEAYHYLTASTYAQIKALEDQGKSDEAAEMAQKAYANAFAERASKMQDNLGLIERSWRSAKDTAIKAWDEFLGVGRKKTPQQRLAEVNAALADADKAPAFGGGENSDWAEMRRAGNSANKDALLKERADLQSQIDKEAWDGQQAAVLQKFEKDRIAWTDELSKYMSSADRMKKEIARAVQLGEDAGASDADIKKVVDKIKSNYASLNNVTLTQLENQRDLQKEIMAGQAADLETQYKLNLISQDDYLAKKRDMQVKEIDLEIPILRKQADLASGKEDKSAREKALGELQVLEQRRKNIINGATNATKEADYARAKAIDNLVGSWDRALSAETDAVSQEVALFGVSDQARLVAIAQIKLETEARKFMADQAKDGHALTQQEIDDLNAKTEARKKSTAEVMNQRAAIAGAQQLLQENRKFSAEYIADEELRAQRVLDIDAAKWRELIANTQQGSEAQRLLVSEFDQWYANRQMTPVLDKWKGVVDGLDNDFREGFRDMLTGGQNIWSSFAKSIGNTLKTSIADALYQTFVKKYVVRIVTSFAGSLSGPAVAGVLSGQGGGAAVQAGGSGVGSEISAAQAASSLYKAISGGFETLSTSVADAVQAGMYQSGMTSQIASNGSFATSAGSATSVAAGMIGGHYLGNALSNGYGIGNHEQAVNNTGVAAGTGIGYYVGGMAGAALGALIGGAAGGFLNRIFGMGDKETSSQGIRGTLSASSLSGESYANWHQDGGWFRSDKDGTDVKALNDAMVKQFTSGLATIETVSAGFATSLGVQADSIKDYSKVFDLKLTGDATKDQQLITDFFSGIGDEIANKLVPNLADFAKSGEAASATLQRLAGDFQSTDQVAQLIGKTAAEAFGTAGIESAKAREQLISLAGSASALTSEAQSYAQNYLTDAERLAPVQKALDAAMASLGLSSVQTRDQFKDVVNSLDLTTEAGAREFASLMALADVFAQVHPAIDAAAEAAKAAADAFESMKSAASTAYGDVDNAYSVLEKEVGREKDAVQATIDAHNTLISKLQGESDALHSALDGMTTSGQKLASRAAAQAEIRADLAIQKAGGKLSDDQVDSLKKALGLVTQDASSQFATLEDYLRDLYQTQRDVGQLGDVTDDSLSVEKASLEKAQEQLKSLDGILTSAQAQIDVLKGQSTTLLSIEQAMQGLNTSVLAAMSNPLVSATQAINQAYQTSLGRTPDAAGLDYWQKAAASGTSVSDIKNAISQSDEARLQTMYQTLLGRPADAAGLQFWLSQLKNGTSWGAIGSALSGSAEAKAHVIPGFASGGDFGGGIALVGEDGPELINTGAARVFNAGQTSNLLRRVANPSSNNDSLIAEVKALRAELQGLRAEARSTAGHTEKSARLLKRVIREDKLITGTED